MTSLPAGGVKNIPATCFSSQGLSSSAVPVVRWGADGFHQKQKTKGQVLTTKASFRSKKRLALLIMTGIGINENGQTGPPVGVARIDNFMG